MHGSRVGARLRLLVTAAVASATLYAAAAPAAHAYVYWSVRGGGSGTTLGRANLDSTSAFGSFVSGATGPVGIAVDGSHIYWANTFGSNTTIGRANLDGTGTKQNFIMGANFPCGVAVDGAHIYWANNGSNTIGRANLDGTGAVQNFITTTGVGPCGVAVNGSFIYWANEGMLVSGKLNGTTIGRASLSSPNTTTNNMFVTGASAPVGVAVNGSYIYWGQDNSNTIGRANLDGTGTPNYSFIPGSGGCTDFPTVDATYIYWANDCDGTIGRATLDGLTVTESFIPVASNPGGVAVDQLAPLTVSLAGTGGGSVTGPGISCPGTCSGSYTVGQTVTLSATPASGSIFAGWSSAGCSGTGACTITIGSEQAVTGIFNAVKPPAPACTPKLKSGTVLLPPKKGHKAKGKTKTKPGTLTLSVTCDQAASLRLTGTVKVVTKKTKHTKSTTKTLSIPRVTASTTATKAVTLIVKLPKAALTALAKGARESVAFTLTASNANGTSKTSASIKRLRHK